MKTIEELSHDTYYQMEKYSQLVIDYVSDYEDIQSETIDDGINLLNSMAYDISLILDIIDPKREDDILVLKNLAYLIENTLVL